jgi:hypothetical protein
LPAFVAGRAGIEIAGNLSLSFPAKASLRSLTPEQNKNYVLHMFLVIPEADMLKTFVEEAAALTSLVLFIGMIAVWAQVIQQL